MADFDNLQGKLKPITLIRFRKNIKYILNEPYTFESNFVYK